MAHIHLWKTVALSLVTTLSATFSLAGAEWGHLTGRFIMTGPVRPPVAIRVPFAVNPPLVDESMIVGAKGEWKNVLIYLRTKNPDVHPDYLNNARNDMVLTLKNFRAIPHVSVVIPTQTLLIKNADPVGYNIRIETHLSPPVNVIIPVDGLSLQTFPRAELLPFKIGCNIHPWLGAWVLVPRNPYAAVSGDDGKFTIEKLPAGEELEFQLWHEGMGYLKNVTFKGGTANDKGRFKLKIKPGDNDLGDVQSLGPLRFP